MMDWSESLYFQPVSRRRVHREIKENLVTANVSRSSEVGNAVSDCAVLSMNIT